jgi:hypothetical protein
MRRQRDAAYLQSSALCAAAKSLMKISADALVSSFEVLSARSALALNLSSNRNL